MTAGTKPTFSFILLLAILVLFTGAFTSCKSRKPVGENEVRELPEVAVRPESTEAAGYRASYTIRHDLLHTDLDVRFDWDKQELLGKAVLTLLPHWYPTNTLYLNAQGMEIHRVALLNGTDTINQEYTYNNDTITLRTEKIYTRSDTLRVFIDYTSKPEELPDVKGSVAISEKKGLYFINHDGSDPVKPRQVWTQGETQSNSVWFPTIESPNQKMTQRIRITVDTAFVTLSNGTMISSVKNNDGTRTDTWEQKQPHAPYLVMLAVGNFAVVKDHWRGKEVNYYVDPEYRDDAMSIFGHTPAMLEFYSEKLGVEYPWDKYSQVIVHDYVSGAMENTTATVHGEFVQRDKRELIDRNFEDYIAHELFHHWFGDLVTCESWSNIPLNESFANYSEYLWSEFYYGRDAADYIQYNDVQAYLREARTKQVNLIRFHYDQREDMYDRHSYEKGGRVLHMLRKYLGDEAFFAGLKKYLTDNRFQSAEIHNLRLAFESVTGEDLNWFFNEWFLDKGHPILRINTINRDSAGSTFVRVEQMQDISTTPLYKLPVDVDFYFPDSVHRERITITKADQSFEFHFPLEPTLINFDAEKMLLCEKNDVHSIAEWKELQLRGQRFLDRLEALSTIVKLDTIASDQAAAVFRGMNDPYFRMRQQAIGMSENVQFGPDNEKYLALLQLLAKGDAFAQVRSAAVQQLKSRFNGSQLTPFFTELLSDTSMNVVQNSLKAISETDKDLALQLATRFENDKHTQLREMVMDLYCKKGDVAQAAYLQRIFEDVRTGNVTQKLNLYQKYLLRIDDETALAKGVEQIAAVKTGNKPFLKMSVYQSLIALADRFKANATDLKYQRLYDVVVRNKKSLIDHETDAQLIKLYGN